MFCSNCGKETDEGMKFCPYCGCEVNGVVKTKPIDTPKVEDEVVNGAVTIIPCENTYEPTYASDESFVRRRKTHRNMIIAGVVIAIIVIASVLSWIFFFSSEKGELGDVTFSLSREWGRDKDSTDSVYYVNSDNRMTFEVERIQKDTLQWMVKFERAVLEDSTSCSADVSTVAGREAIKYQYTADLNGDSTDAMTVIFSYNKNLYTLRLLDKQKSGNLQKEMDKIVETIELKSIHISSNATEEYKGIAYEPFPEGWTKFTTDKVSYVPGSGPNPNCVYGFTMEKLSKNEAFNVMDQLTRARRYGEFNIFVGGKRAKFYAPYESFDGYSYVEKVIIPIGNNAYDITFITDRNFSTESVLTDFLLSVEFREVV